MEKKKKKNLEAPVHQNTRSANPSFSSTLLESIYRSIDQKPGIEKPEAPDEEIIMSTSFYHSNKFSNNAAAAAVLSNSNSNSSSSSSELSFWSGGLSSSDSESAHYYYGSRSSSSCYSMQRPKPIRTERSSSYGPSKNNQEQDKAKMMSKALKIYNELKKVKKQPISPGGKLSSFLNSLFAHPKKPKNKPSEPIISKSKSNSYVSTSTPNCSSASSYTRSCLSKTPSSKLSNNGSKRSVRFFPVSVIVDEDSQPCGQKNLLREEEDDDDELRVVRVMEENRKVAEAAKKLLESYRKPKKESYGGDDDGEDDDGMSCASSDLFELNNISDIGMGRYNYSEELPVYETTHVDTNRAIANGLIV